MTSFDTERTRSHSESEAYQKFPYKRIEPSVGKFITILKANIDRLKKHRCYIEKCLATSDWSNLHSEQVNASRTVQQIHATMREMERARNQLHDEDLPKFDSKVSEINKAAVETVIEFMDKCGTADVPQVGPNISDSENVSNLSTHDPSGEQAGTSHSLVQTVQIPEGTEAAESWEKLKDSLIELNSLVHEFSTIVHDQQEKVDSIEDNINQAHDDVQQGVYNLSKAGKLKAAIYPLTGAVLGGVFGGPVGLVAGLKIGSVAAMGGGVVGFMGGRYLKKRQSNVQETELSNLSKVQPMEKQVSKS